MHILHLCPPRVRTHIQQFPPSRDPTSVLLPAQVIPHATTLRSFPLLEILLYLGQHLPLMLVPLQLYLDLACPLSLRRYKFLTYGIAIRFKPSPFFQIDQAVSGVVECPGMRNQLTDITLLNTAQSPLVLATVVNKRYYFLSPLIRLQS
jgi:hypothetical protein